MDGNSPDYSDGCPLVILNNEGKQLGWSHIGPTGDTFSNNGEGSGNGCQMTTLAYPAYSPDGESIYYHAFPRVHCDDHAMILAYPKP